MIRARLPLAVLALLATSVASAQVFEGAAGAFTVQSHTRFATGRHEQAGPWFGGDVSVQFARLRLGVSGGLGQLAGDADSVTADRTGRFTTLSLHYAFRPWVSIGGAVEAKVFETDLGTRAWLLIGPNVRLTPMLDDGSLEGLFDLTVWPSARVVNGETMPLALRATVGATYRLAASPIGIRVAYRFERFDFEGAAATARLEQFRGAMAGVVVRLAR